MTTTHVATKEEKGAERTRVGRAYQPNVDILETKDELTLVADMPGVNRDAIDVNFDDGVLSIHGKVEPRWPEGGIQAEYANGVLTLHLPKAEAAKPRKIAVQSAS
jgi:HSP20 family protein